MSETSIARARRLAREKREAEEDRKRREAEKKEAPPAKKEEKGFFDSFFNRGEAIDEAVEGRRQNQHTDKANS